jgi:hypothetical protein
MWALCFAKWQKHLNHEILLSLALEMHLLRYLSQMTLKRYFPEMAGSGLGTVEVFLL